MRFNKITEFESDKNIAAEVESTSEYFLGVLPCLEIINPDLIPLIDYSTTVLVELNL